MAKITQKLGDFDKIGVEYDPEKNPYFKVTLVECLRLIESVDLGAELLELIAAARPKVRKHNTGYTIPEGINVLARPVSDMEGTSFGYVQAGYKSTFVSGTMDKTLVKSDSSRHEAGEDAPDGCQFYILGGSKNAAADPTASGNSQGSACFMYFTNAQFLTTKGRRCFPHIVLAHELIHSYHCLYGIKKQGKDEELWTTGISQFEGERMSENGFLAAFNMEPRKDYF